ncbi:FAD linked oxidase domain protein [Magnetococcus marinus MC-1]|uniref:FAD linked oxidase domain protein n=1 Tax=Magnetococcus marinus (strain ATCC BAA-1437 / JCM 17883 / MC-1) TaxID=156889 RepID=A0LCU2_MAGMM|nr:FAD-linked oxidase C-terminal domain-containing protein [Magnetococcus marinus]ABK45785.1 FAD linked oxidase domain protein [Magnetococcus marinus MC-1]
MNTKGAPHSGSMAVLTALQARLGAHKVLRDGAHLESYAWDNTGLYARPDGVVLASTLHDVQTTLALCHAHRVAVTPRTAGTGNVGGALAVEGGIVLSLQRMNRILEINPADRLVVVEPGVVNADLQDQLSAHGLFWPPNPSSSKSCAIGGNLAMCAAGPNAVRYGVVRDWVLGLELVTAEGKVMRTGSRCSKSVTGYDMTRLLVGSEGTLGVITQAILKLTPKPAVQLTMRVVYASVTAAAQAVSAIMAAGVPPSALEFMDSSCLGLLRQAGMAIPAQGAALLLLEVADEVTRVEGEVARLQEILQRYAPLELVVARQAAQAKAVWAARYALSPLLKNLAPKRVNEDVAVPVSRLPELIEGLQRIAERVDLPIVNFGHAGNGNIHVNLLVDPEDSVVMARLPDALDRVFDLVVKLDGTLSGEHGIGYQKRDYLGWELDAENLAMQRRLKALFDPNGILNPGKLFSPKPRATLV